MPLLEVYPVKELEVLRVLVRGRERIIWRDAVTKRFVKKHTIKIMVTLECEEYEEIPRKRVQVHGFCEYYILPIPERSIEEQVEEVKEKLLEDIQIKMIELGFDALLDYCEDTGRLKEDYEVEPADITMTGWCECKVKWRHKPIERWKSYEWYCTI